MLDYCITSSILSAQKNFVRLGGSYSYTESIPDSIAVYSDEYRKKNCLRTSMLLQGDVLDTKSDIENYTSALSIFDKQIPLSQFMPKKIYRTWLDTVIKSVERHVDTENNYYFENYVKYDRLYESLQRAYVDKKLIQYHGQLKNADNSVLFSFLPASDGLCNPVQYDRISSRTGRLKVASGPSILTLRRDCRDILTSRYKNGRICSVDYSGLEARVFAAISGAKIPAENDIYTQISEEMFAGEFKRDVIKAVVLSLLYGMSDISLSLRLGYDISMMRKISKKVKRYFKYDELHEKLESLFENDRIRNYYGRSVVVHEERLLINSYVQSSAVDVVQHGFLNVIDSIGSRGIVPLFVLHDALIVDVDEDVEDDFFNCANRIKGFDMSFPVHVTQFC